MFLTLELQTGIKMDETSHNNKKKKKEEEERKEKERCDSCI